MIVQYYIDILWNYYLDFFFFIHKPGYSKFAIMSATGVPKELVEKSKTSDVYFSAEDAVRYGIAHSIEREIL